MFIIISLLIPSACPLDCTEDRTRGPLSNQPFAAAFVRALTSKQHISGSESPTGTPTTKGAALHSDHAPSPPHHLALLFLSQLDDSQPPAASSSPEHRASPFSARLQSLPCGLKTLIHVLLGRCRADPPLNCPPQVYHMMGERQLTTLPIDIAV